MGGKGRGGIQGAFTRREMTKQRTFLSKKGVSDWGPQGLQAQLGLSKKTELLLQARPGALCQQPSAHAEV